jgi:hypothetical protein
VALLAGRREAARHVIGIGRAVEVLHMARSAICGRSHKLSIDVALRAGHAHVPPRQRELCKHIVIKRRWVPRAAAMASLAGRREARLRMRGIARLIKVRQVATHAGGRRSRKLSTHVARCAV